MLTKKSLLVLALVVTLIFATTVDVLASDTSTKLYTSSIKEVVTVQDGIVDDNVTRNNYLVIDNENIYTSGKYWDQPSGYASYRIFVSNTKNETMKVTVSYGSLSYDFNVSANGTNTITVNNAQAVRHYVSFSTNSGAVSGTISVRVSNTPL